MNQVLWQTAKSIGKIEEVKLKNTNLDYEMSILVGHKPISEYFHDGMTFVEGRNGSEYKIRIRNNTYRRACFVVSVDGLSVLDGKDAGDNSPGYILEARGVLDIACYKVDDATGAKFVFGTKEHSYSAEIGKGTDNTGVIAVKVFQEKYRPYVPPITIAASCTGMPTRRTKSSSQKIIGSSGPSFSKSPTRSGGWGFGEASYNAAGSMSTNVAGSLSSQGMASDRDVWRETQADADEGLGTVFGESVGWKTTQVAFEREAVAAAQMVIYYDTKKGLERRGVKLEHKTPPLPNPFPADQGCSPPPGWRK